MEMDKENGFSKHTNNIKRQPGIDLLHIDTTISRFVHPLFKVVDHGICVLVNQKLLVPQGLRTESGLQYRPSHSMGLGIDHEPSAGRHVARIVEADVLGEELARL